MVILRSVLIFQQLDENINHEKNTREYLKSNKDKPTGVRMRIQF